eukprot:TRINITY_DN2349_c0_g1_i1.p1 TRINITY_DN2349_c0_g1~~TRINITY_DN2349_c0_g1_i1.p1  ORF type:complete len:143 (+),score=22.39 TRINITY_DN2349_c0_g1_i1:220-648(+)
MRVILCVVRGGYTVTNSDFREDQESILLGYIMQIVDKKNFDSGSKFSVINEDLRDEIQSLIRQDVKSHLDEDKAAMVKVKLNWPGKSITDFLAEDPYVDIVSISQWKSLPCLYLSIARRWNLDFKWKHVSRLRRGSWVVLRN